ncbi:MAG: hypothetical protein UW71_C0038G0004 [Parcubacteria group bacterium GW2011_GWB1_44_7]|nr:MAG: hypothetical protein UW71_C0038G0004 [Parcubacteria group bacterium GW2011_GWB1_44_7]
MGLKGFAAGSSFGDVFTEAEKQGLVTMVVGNDEFFRRHRRNNAFTASQTTQIPNS